MPFIGNKPTAIPLSADDLEDNIISSAKIQDNAVTAAKYIEPIPFRNIITNGDMSIAQRGTSVSSHSSDSYTTVDRWKTRVSGLGVWTVSQSTDVPTGQGFAKSLKWECTTADASPSAGDFLLHEQKFEGQNLQYLKYGTASAESLTVSFWVKSNKTGAYTIGFFCAGNNKHIESSYTINSADTWEKKNVTFVGDTASALANDNTEEMKLWFWLGAGSNFSSGTHATSWSSYSQANVLVDNQVNLADNTANEFYITGVQLEAGTTASDFEFLPFDVNLQRCYRYYETLMNGSEGTSKCFNTCFYYNSTSLHSVCNYRTEKRTTPTLNQSSGTNYFRITRSGGTDDIDDLLIARATKYACLLYNTSDASGTTGHAGELQVNNASAYIALDAEL